MTGRHSDTFTCDGCGFLIPDTEEDAGCYVCCLCQGCTPDAGTRLDCDDMRRENETERAIDYANENPEVPC